MAEKDSTLYIEDDDVYPLYTFDDGKYNRKLLSWVMRFNDVLDPKKLNDSLSRLLEIGDWRKLGGRLKLRESGKLEIHAPKQFSASRPAVSFSHNDFSGVPIEEHPIACRFPEPTIEPSIQPIRDFGPFLAPQGYPKTIEEMISRRLPQISLHVTSFRNATLVALAWPHTLMDAIGHQELLRGWSLVLAGREHHVPPLLGARKDILKELEDEEGETEREPFALKRHRIGRLGIFALLARFLWDKFWSAPLELRAIYLPTKALARLQSTAQQQIDQLAKDTKHGSFVSEGDVLTAWTAQAIAQTRPGLRPVTLVNFFNLRYRLPRLRDEASGVYIQNMTQMNYTFCSPQLARGALGHLALQNRRQLVEQTSTQQSLSLMRSMRQRLEAGKGLNVFYGETNALPIFCNNLTKVDLIKAADFAPAVLTRGDCKENRVNPPGTMIMYYNQLVEETTRGPDCVYVLGKDYGGNYWLLGNLLPQTWTRLDEDLQKLKGEAIKLSQEQETELKDGAMYSCFG
ncbi:hypothetical protein XA68_12931 [Ophiocordyceps unilateralis]|uniref:Uncharacterized protein n=1 Tax=Ophiocordyceps unilateralis TaxID=268505 RepID=A0A2A9PDK8_OPHUN|nr:hypothetical protein XA68_12931 [Ophiocordyceps unilateralis]